MEKFGISRREFLKLGLVGAGAMVLRPWERFRQLIDQWPDAERLGRNCTGGWINLRAKPSSTSTILGTLYEDAVVVWLREVVGEAASVSRRWVETPDGYVYAPGVQPVRNVPNIPLTTLPITSQGQGLWMEVTVPYVDLILANPPARSPWVQEITNPRLYYSQVIWVNDITQNSQGQTLYHVVELYGSYGDEFWASAEAFRPIAQDEIALINPEKEDKRIVVDVNHQTLSCYEGQSEVYFCRVSTGAKFDAYGNAVDQWSTPIGSHLPWRKVISIHMSGGSTGAGYDTMGIPWSTIFDPDGAAIHSTFWHNDFGTPRSHGCVNTAPEDAKWIFRWSLPSIQYVPGDISIQGPGGTIVNVIEA